MKLNRRYQDGQEFKARQGRFDFAEVALAVLEIAVSVKKQLCGWWSKVKPVVVHAVMRKPHQLVLELNDIQQMPLFRRTSQITRA